MNFIKTYFLSYLVLLRALPTPAKTAVLLFFLAGLADGTLTPFFALWAQKEAGVPTEYIGLLLGCYAGGEILAAPFIGGIADRVGRRPVLIVSATGVGIGFLFLSLTRGVFAAAASLICIGIFESVLHPTAATVIADVVPADRLRQHFGLTRLASNFGRVVGPAAGAFLVLRSLGSVFIGSGLSMLVGAFAVAALLTETRPPKAVAEDDDDESIMSLMAAFRDRRLASLLLPIALLQIGSSWIETIMPLYATRAGTVTPSGIGWLFTYGSVLSVLFQLPISSAKISGFAAVVASGLALALAFGSLSISTSLILLIAAVTLDAFSQMLFRPLTQTMVTELAPENSRATYMAAFSAVNDLKDTLGPAIGTYLYSFAVRLPWMIGVPIALAASVSLAISTRRHEIVSARKAAG
jgi:MFS family permease